MGTPGEILVLLRPAGPERVERRGATAVVTVPDADAAARFVAAHPGAALVELYGGFDLVAAARVAAAAGGTPVGLGGPRSRVDRSVVIVAAEEDAGPIRFADAEGWIDVVFRAGLDAERRAAEEAVAAGARAVELCGGIALTDAAQVAAAIGDRAVVTLVTWPFDALDGAAAYKAAYAEAHS